MEVVAEEITIVKVSGEISVKTALEEAASGVVDLIIDTIHHHRFLDKGEAPYDRYYGYSAVIRA
jgi:hypothetical protein